MNSRTMTRSNVLLKTGVMEIGQKSACSYGVAVLGTGAIDANFHCLGTVEEAEKWRKLKKGKILRRSSRRRERVKRKRGSRI